nr:basic immunoglobulin-like variable motif-containing protein [Biomphalaria glabrata]
MGNSVPAAQPYIVDEYESEEDDLPYESAVETVESSRDRDNSCDDSKSSDDEQAEKKKRHKISPLKPHSPEDEAKTLAYLLEVLQSCESEGSQQAAAALKDIELNGNVNRNKKITSSSIRFSLNPEGIQEPILSEPSFSESSASIDHAICDSSDAGDDSKSCQVTLTPLFSSDCESNTFLDTSESQMEDIHRDKVLAQLDEDLNQFEAAEAAIAELSSSHIPKPKVSMLPRSRKDRMSCGDATEIKKPSEGKRGQSPGQLRTSGIPRYSGSPNHSSTYARVSSSSLESETERITLDMLPTETSSEYIPVANSFLKTENLPELEESKVEDDSSSWDINISEITGRARQAKKRSGIPSLWSKTDPSPIRNKSFGDQTVENKLKKNDVMCSHSFSQMSEGEKADVRAIGEFGNTSERKIFDLKRWYCISRPQYKTSCGISSLVSCWNYLYSTMGNGRLKPLTQEAAMKILGFQSPFEEIKFGPVTGNLTLLRWFQELNSHFDIKGKGYFLYKPCGKNRTAGLTEEQALQKLKQGLQDPNRSFVYHCHNHYFCPIGYEDTPMFSVDAYKANVGEKAVDTWILIGDTSRKFPCIQCTRWEDICIDLKCPENSYFNIRQNWRGIISAENSRRPGTNLHCILAFQKEESSSPLNKFPSRLPVLSQHNPSPAAQNSSSSITSINPTIPSEASLDSPPASPLDSNKNASPIQEEEEVSSRLFQSGAPTPACCIALQANFSTCVTLET